VKLLVDMNLSPHWVDRLNAAGLPAVHWLSVGRMDAPDIEIMAHAAKYDYVVLTHDLDFSAILAATQGTKPSVVQIRSDNLSPAVIGGCKVNGSRQSPGYIQLR
jgi:predicted nuclease of predicted toxin-antitoxin system